MIYADHAATTFVAPSAIEAMTAFWTTQFGNPSSQHTMGLQARAALEEARAHIAACIDADPSEILFTSGGSESNNTAVFGMTHAVKRFCCSALEHPSVRQCERRLAESGFSTAIIPADRNGFIQPNELEKRLDDCPALISVMTANNEIGTVQPISSLVDVAHRNGSWFHTDAVQAIGIIPVSVRETDVDLLSASGHKFHAPKGIGFLYVRTGCPLRPYILGGGQEQHRRAGTENVAFAVGMAAALDECVREREKRAKYVAGLRDLLWTLLRDLPVRLNGTMRARLPGNLSVRVDGMDGEALTALLDLRGICVSAGSACCAGTVHASPVLRAIGLSDAECAGALRITLNHTNTEAEIYAISDALHEIVRLTRP